MIGESDECFVGGSVLLFYAEHVDAGGVVLPFADAAEGVGVLGRVSEFVVFILVDLGLPDLGR